ncbi:MAG: tripartite tricarboxylate transporter TctB family protein [Pseudomonadota bacterium]
MTNRWANIGFSTIIIFACGVFSYIAMGFDNPSALAGSQVPTQVFPIAMLAFTAICSAINIVNYLTGNPEGDADELLDFDGTVALRVGLIIALMILTYFVWEPIGFIPTSIILCLGIAVVMQVRSPLVYIGLAIYGPLVWAVFNYGIGISL